MNLTWFIFETSIFQTLGYRVRIQLSKNTSQLIDGRIHAACFRFVGDRYRGRPIEAVLDDDRLDRVEGTGRIREGVGIVPGIVHLVGVQVASEAIERHLVVLFELDVRLTARVARQLAHCEPGTIWYANETTSKHICIR